MKSEDGAAHGWDLARGGPAETAAGAPLDPRGELHLEALPSGLSWSSSASQILNDPETGEPIGHYEAWSDGALLTSVSLSTARDRVLLVHDDGSTVLLDATPPQKGRFVDVHPWLTHAIDHVPRLAEGIGGVQRPLLAVPRGGATFDVGALEPAERARIPIAIERPLVVRAGFQDEDEMVDTLDLGEQVDDALRDLSASARGAPFVFVEVNALPGAYKIVGRYRVEDGEVAATARLVRDKDRLVEFPLRGRADAAGELARAIVVRVSAALHAGRPS